MSNGPDTGEFVALTVSGEQATIQAKQLAKRVEALSECLTTTIVKLHNSHRSAGMSKESKWEDCSLVSCRNAKAILNGGFSNN